MHAATTDRRQIVEWWSRWPGAGVAIRTGAPSGLFVLDIDPSHGGDRSLDRLLGEHGPLPASRTIATGGGGHHLYFRHPDQHLANTAGRLGPGIDTRGDGGYVLAPPTRHASGASYTVKAHGHVLPALPAWLADALRAEPSPAPARRAPPTTRGDAAAWARAAVEGELARLGRAVEGCRNDTLNRVAFRLGQIIGAGRLTESDIEPLLIERGIALGLREREVNATVRSGLRAGEHAPRGPSPPPSDDPHVPTPGIEV